MDKTKVLFVCVHNSARSQMAETFLKDLGGDDFEVVSAGIDLGTINSYVVKSMAKVGYDISQNDTKSVFELFKQGYMFQYVIALCDYRVAEQCPIFPGMVERVFWPFDNPADFVGTEEEILAQVAVVREAIKQKVEDFIQTLK